ncbi:MAG: MerR family transcriptional regulator [Chloroflexota bacterium]|nr:MerR family transcriptional regulator [Chloroflexota bacterium]
MPGGRGEETISDPDGREALAQVLVANDTEVVSRLRLSAAEAARVCRVTPRQLIYWTKKGLVRPSPEGEHDYDVFAMEKVIRIRQALEKGHSLEKAAAIVQRDMAQIQADVERLSAMTAEELEGELRRRLERLEERVAALRAYLPTSLGIARLRRAVALLARLDVQGSLSTPGRDGDGSKALALRLGRAADELEQLLHEVPASAG